MKLQNKNIGFIGDTHGKFDSLNGKIQRLDITDTVLFHVGDFGIASIEWKNCYKKLKILNNTLHRRNCYLFVIRGNHDDPSRFTGEFMSNIILVKDYTLVDVDNYKILMVGGAVSIDRKIRLNKRQKESINGRLHTEYFFDEEFNLDLNKVSENIDIVVTHSSPDFVYPFCDKTIRPHSHGPIIEGIIEETGDYSLKNDINKERESIGELYYKINKSGNIKYWFYGHFHESRRDNYNTETSFILLNENEIFELNKWK